MVNKTGVFCIVLSVSLVILASCATTRDVKTWKDDSYQGKLTKVLVVAAFDEPLMRGFIENEFIKQLQAKGVEGIPSKRIIPTEKIRDKEAVIAAIKGSGADTVLVTKVADVQHAGQMYGGGIALVPTYYGGWDNFYTESFAEVPVPVYQYDVDIIMLQTKVFDLKKEKLIFSAVSKTYVDGAKESVVKPFVGVMVNELAGAKLLQ